MGGFSFYGFGGIEDRIARKITKVGIRSDEPNVILVEDVVFVPAEDRRRVERATGEPGVSGGVVARDGRPIDAAHLRRNRGKVLGGLSEPIDVTPDREVDQEVVYLGWLWDHFGLVLLESLARAWILPQVGASVPLLFHFPNRPSTLPAWMMNTLAAFGISEERISVPSTTTRFRRMLIPEPLFEQMHGAHERMIRPFQEVAARLAGDVRPSAQPVYLSRRLLTSQQRPMIGEAELEDVLRENGFLVVHPETMTFEQQVRLFNAHADIFSGVGSAAHNVLFSLNQPALHLLANGDRIPSNFFLCSALADAPTSFINCVGTGEQPSFADERKIRKAASRADGPRTGTVAGTGSQATPQLLDIVALVDYLRERGFLKKTLRASLAGRDPALRGRHDEAWFYARLRAAANLGESLPPSIIDQAANRADRLWPVAFMLAHYHAHGDFDAPRVALLLNRFAELVAGESDVNRLAYYHAEVELLVPPLSEMCDSAIRARLAITLRERFNITQNAPHVDARET